MHGRIFLRKAAWIDALGLKRSNTIQLLSSALLDQRIQESRIRIEAGVRQCF